MWDLLPQSLNLKDIATATKDDKTLQSVILFVKTNRWDRKRITKDKAYGVYAKLSHESAYFYGYKQSGNYPAMN